MLAQSVKLWNASNEILSYITRESSVPLKNANYFLFILFLPSSEVKDRAEISQQRFPAPAIFIYLYIKQSNYQNNHTQRILFLFLSPL